ncbi:hypothetical protein NP511_22610 (plasmid) [Natrinema thermotolerans]|uniref:Uncharacterized protein n=1 Tax=Natrinema thermotolerans TaxID=121872 RepID=A0AAF0PFU7_9EURY|nr:hypothetical protein [Natrinema thermotolerans]WMT10360.1 hypothetical protein NP511_22610 [Natrinema thermotolerans]
MHEESGSPNSHGAPTGNSNAEGNAGGGAPQGNMNAVKHGAYADNQRFYEDVLDNRLRNLVDEIFEDYVEGYKRRHGEPSLGHKAELFRLSISHVKDLVLDRWMVQRPEEIETENPLVEVETEKKFVETVGPIDKNTYNMSVTIAAQQRLSSDRRQWIRDLGLLEDPETQKAGALMDGIGQK